MPSKGYGGGNTRPARNFHTGMLGSDSTGSNMVSKINEVKKRGRMGKRNKYMGNNGRWD